MVRNYSYNLIPFKEIHRFIAHRDVLGAKAVWLNLAGNVAAFIPFRLCVEIIQLVAKVGSFDVDDLLLNTLGGLLGALLYKLFKRIERIRADGKA